MQTNQNFQNSFASTNLRSSMESKKILNKCNKASEFSKRNLLLATLFCSLSLTLFVIFARQFRLLDFFDIFNLNIKENIFSEIKIKFEGKSNNLTEEFSIFGRKLVMGNGDYFLNIPYALETNRFEQAKLAPLPKDFYAINYGIGCPNALPDLHWNPPPLELISAPEQCHTLNIYRCTSFSLKNISSPILVIINDGNWLKRSNANFDPSIIIENFACNRNNGDNGIIVVSINYRIGFYGLEWIKQNIIHFGGNEEEITLLASGEGARLVSLLGIIEQGKTLFKRQIFFSGSLFSPLTFQYEFNKNNESTFDSSIKFAIGANCLNDNELNQIIKDKNNNNYNDLKIKIENCLIGLNQQEIISIQNKIKFPNLNQWPIITSQSDEHNNASNRVFYVPENPFSKSSQIPSIIGFCTHPRILNQKSEQIVPSQMNEAFQTRVNNAIKDELFENLRQMIDFKKASEEYWGESGLEELKNYYLNSEKFDRLLKEFNGEIMKNMEDLIKRISTDFFIDGPTVFEWVFRTFLFNARVYGFVFEHLEALNISRIDKAEEGARQTNLWASGQPACLDELLLNGLPEEFKEQNVGKAVDDFANRLVSFIAFGDPNPENGKQSLIEWPTERQTFPKWLNLPINQIEDGGLDKFLIVTLIGYAEIILSEFTKI
ncbi:COesterase domain-containing protein [Meloidogyne graminicola]|uniref:COesterase domain-containing protein n=1 Tax=Meloidogyne graminicola TaxID=189291 RepID=A0A8T0A0T3_9BILA|nr:COesterase domain-containing protein [Meloidogyne graminicola]